MLENCHILIFQLGKSFGIGFKTDSPYSKPPLITDTRESMSFRA